MCIPPQCLMMQMPPSSASSRSHQRRVLIHILIHKFCSYNVLYVKCFWTVLFLAGNWNLIHLHFWPKQRLVPAVLGVGWYCSLFVSWIMELWSWLIAQSAVIPTPTRTNSKLSNFKTKAGEFVKLLKIPAAAAEESSAAESGMWFLIPLPLVAPVSSVSAPTNTDNSWGCFDPGSRFQSSIFHCGPAGNSLTECIKIIVNL